MDRVGGVDASARADAKAAREVADRLAGLLDDPVRGFAAVRKTAEDTAAAVSDKDTGLVATRATVGRLARRSTTKRRFVATGRWPRTPLRRSTTRDGARGNASHRRRGVPEVYNTSSRASGATGDGVAGNTDGRLEASNDENEEAIRLSTGASFST